MAVNRVTKYKSRVFVQMLSAGIMLCSLAVQAESSGKLKLLKSAKQVAQIGHYVELAGNKFVVWGAEKTGSMPKGLTTSIDGQWVFASNLGRKGRRNISVYRAKPFKFERDLSFVGNSIELAPSPDGKWLFSTNQKNYGYFDVLDMKDLTLKQHIRLKGFPKFILPDPTGTYVYVSLWLGDGITRIKWPEGTMETLKLKGYSRYSKKKGRSKNPRGMVLSKDGRTLYVTNNNDRSLSIVDVESFSERKRVNVGVSPRHVVISPDGKLLYISLTGPSRIVVFDTESEKIVRKIRTGARPKSIEISRDGQFIYSSDYRGHSLTIVDTNTYETKTIKLNILKSSGIAVHPDDSFVYITGWCTNDLWAIQRLKPGEEPLLPMGKFRHNRPCYKCDSPPTGCPSSAEIRRVKALSGK